MKRRTVIAAPALVALVALASAGSLPGVAPRTAHAAGQDAPAWVWGANHSGELGDGTRLDHNAPEQNQLRTVTGGGGAIQLSGSATGDDADAAFSLAVTASGAAWAWGDDTFGQLGDGQGCAKNTCTRPVPVKGVGGTGTLNGITAVSAGGQHSLALGAHGAVWAWGDNEAGEVASASCAPTSSTTYCSTPVAVETPANGQLTGMRAVAGGQLFSLALSATDGTVQSWGASPDDFANQAVHPVPTIAGASAIAAGVQHGLAVVGGAVYAWGDNTTGELGVPCAPTGYLYTCDRFTPAAVPGLSGVGCPAGAPPSCLPVAAGDGFSLALKTDGTVWAWGWDVAAQLGSPPPDKAHSCNPSAPSPISECTSTPTVVRDASGFPLRASAIAAGSLHSMALKPDGSVWAWGWNENGQLGNGTVCSGDSCGSPTPVSTTASLPPAAAIAAGYAHSMALASTSQPAPTPPSTPTGTSAVTQGPQQPVQPGHLVPAGHPAPQVAVAPAPPVTAPAPAAAHQAPPAPPAQPHPAAIAQHATSIQSAPGSSMVVGQPGSSMVVGQPGSPGVAAPGVDPAFGEDLSGAHDYAMVRHVDDPGPLVAVVLVLGTMGLAGAGGWWRRRQLARACFALGYGRSAIPAWHPPSPVERAGGDDA